MCLETTQQPALQLATIRKAIPEECFVKSLPRSLFYMFRDYCLWLTTVFLMWSLTHSQTWFALPFWAQIAVTVLYWNVAGFFMWCLFVVGHDCGHGTFSESELLNDILGHVMHGSILVPYYPWQLSHRRHHMYHNHLTKDYSHPWYTKETLQDPAEVLARFMHSHWLLQAAIPVYGWPLYLLGKPDGCHYVPIPGQRMWDESPAMEWLKCILSTVVVVVFGAMIYSVFGHDLSAIGFFIGVPWLVFGWWLVTVTYLQHHAPGTVVYEDADWKFVNAAFETIDRLYGFGVDAMHHHISDCHVIHHLFFTKIPHYHLPQATEALVKYLKEHNLDSLYKYEVTLDFPLRVHQHFMSHGFVASVASPAASSKKQQ